MQASTQKALDESAVAMKELELALAKANAPAPGPAPNENIGGNYVLATREPPTALVHGKQQQQPSM